MGPLGSLGLVLGWVVNLQTADKFSVCMAPCQCFGEFGGNFKKDCPMAQFEMNLLLSWWNPCGHSNLIGLEMVRIPPPLKSGTSVLPIGRDN